MFTTAGLAVAIRKLKDDARKLRDHGQCNAGLIM